MTQLMVPPGSANPNRNSGEWQRPPSKNDIVSKRSRWYAQVWRFVRGLLPWAFGIGLIYTIVTWMSASRSNFQLGMYFIQMAIQIVFALVFAIMQFVAIFWFMGRTKMESIKPEDPKSVTFKEYWGQPTLVKLVKQWITLLSDRDQFVKMGGKYINGVLLYGPPGTGKTLLAKCMAGEAGIPFISVEGSGFRGMFWGVDVLRMMQFVGKAKKLAREYGACIAYIDEIDAVAMSRGNVMGGMGMMGGMMGGMGAGSGSLTRLLYEMDGIEDRGRIERLRDRWLRFIGKQPPKRNWHVLFMGSTNRPDVLDPALLRPGRFDQKIQVDAPDKAGRREVVRGYLSKVKHDDTVDVEAIVEDTPHATPAQIASAITKDAVRIALFNGREQIAQSDIDRALQEQAFGIEQPIEELDPEQRRQVAYHEAGHAVTTHYLLPEQRIVRVTIIRRGGAMGYVMPVDRVEVYAYPLRRLAAQIMVLMAGHVATKVFLGEYWNGASADFSWIRRLIWSLYSFGYFGPPVRGAENSSSGGGIPPGADPLIERFWKVLEEQTEQFLNKHADEVHDIAEALLEKGDLSHDEVMALLGDNGWRPEQKILRPLRQPAQLPGAERLPLPAPALADTDTHTIEEPAVQQVDVAIEPAAPKAEEPRAAPTAKAETSAAPRAARMVPPPRPEDIARRRVPSESAAKPAAPNDSKAG